METTEAISGGTLKADGTLELDRPLGLPPGRVEVRVRRVPQAAMGDSMWTVLERIWAERAGRTPRTAAEIDAEINALRDESEERLRAVEAIQAAGARARGHL